MVPSRTMLALALRLQIRRRFKLTIGNAFRAPSDSVCRLEALRKAFIAAWSGLLASSSSRGVIVGRRDNARRIAGLLVGAI